MLNKKHILLITLLAFLFIGAIATIASARDFTLQLEANSDPKAIGYLVYYKGGDKDLPLNGTEAKEGPSPIDIGSSLSATISGLDDDQVYYIGVTAYDAFGNESELSAIISTDWRPRPVSPENQDSLSPDNVEFVWETPPIEISSYKLAYSTDSSTLNELLASRSANGAVLLAGMSLIGLAGLGIKRKKMNWALPLLLASSVFLVHGCGGGGGSDGSAPSEGAEWSTSKMGVVTDIQTNIYTVNNLEPSTTYHWKVVAVDTNGVELESPVYSFTTEQL